MAISIKHSKVSTVPDSANSQIIQPSDWNSPLVSEITTGKLVGRTTAGSGPFEEISTGEGLTFANNEIKVNATIARTSDLTSAVNDLTGDIGDLASQTQTSLNLKLDASAYNASDILVKLRTVDGVGSGLDADYLAGQNANFYRNADNINAGTINNARLPARIGGSPWSNLIANWDWATTTGWYGGAQAENSPTEGYYVGLVESSTGVYLKQTLWEYAVMGSTDTKTWQRTGMWNVSQWEFGPWYRLRLSETEQQNLWDARYQQRLWNTKSIEIGGGVVGNDSAFIDLHASEGVDYSARIARGGGVNGNLDIVQTGSGSITINGGFDLLRNSNPILHTGTQALTSPQQTQVKTNIGLGNVDNTSDANKPVSTATQTALNLKLNSDTYTAEDVLNKVKTVDGTGSGLDADLLDGQHGSYYQSRSNHTGTQSISTVDGLETALEESISMSTVMAIALG